MVNEDVVFEEATAKEETVEAPEEEKQPEPKKQKKSFLDSLTERVKDFLDNAE